METEAKRRKRYLTGTKGMYMEDGRGRGEAERNGKGGDGGEAFEAGIEPRMISASGKEGGDRRRARAACLLLTETCRECAQRK
jgi:hypothetical protein